MKATLGLLAGILPWKELPLACGPLDLEVTSQLAYPVPELVIGEIGIFVDFDEQTAVVEGDRRILACVIAAVAFPLHIPVGLAKSCPIPEYPAAAVVDFNNLSLGVLRDGWGRTEVAPVGQAASFMAAEYDQDLAKRLLESWLRGWWVEQLGAKNGCHHGIEVR